MRALRDAFGRKEALKLKRRACGALHPSHDVADHRQAPALGFAVEQTPIPKHGLVHLLRLGPAVRLGREPLLHD